MEPLASVLGAWLVTTVSAVLPYARAFAAGAMIFVVAEQLIPGSQREGNVTPGHRWGDSGILGHDGAGRALGKRAAAIRFKNIR